MVLRRFAWVVAAALLVLLLVVVFVFTTEQGTSFLLNKVAQETNLKITYEKGTLYHGVHLRDIEVLDSPIQVKLDHGFVKFGFGALLHKQVHLSQAKIGTLVIDDPKSATDTPFAYPKLALPIRLWLQDTHIDKIVYRQASSEVAVLTNIALVAGHWHDSQIKIEQGRLGINDEVFVSGLNGTIVLSDAYPVHASGQVLVKSLQKQYFDELDVRATGDLKQTKLHVLGRYNQANLQIKAVLEPLTKNTPFEATLDAYRLSLPYAHAQNIVLSDVNARFVGDQQSIGLSWGSDVRAKDIPSGHYQGRATLRPQVGMTVHELTAKTAHGDLEAAGVMDWQDKFWLTSTLKSQNFQLPSLLHRHRQYQPYVPKVLNGNLDFSLWQQESGTLYKANLLQKNSETITIQATTDGENDTHHDISVSWHNVVRDLPDGHFKSPKGSANIDIKDKTYIDGRVLLDQYLGLPKGEYSTVLMMNGKDLDIKKAQYRGQGVVSATGSVLLAKDKRPLSYRLAVNAKDFSGRLPASSAVSGTAQIVGTSQNDKHSIELQDTNLTARLANNQTLKLVGQGKAKLAGQHILGEFVGTLTTQGVHRALNQADIRIHAQGTKQKLVVDGSQIKGDIGELTAKGSLGLEKNVAWDLSLVGQGVKLDGLHDELAGVFDGTVETTGLVRTGKISLDAQVVGRLNGGDLLASLALTDEKLAVNRLNYAQKDAHAQLAGWLDLGRGVSGELSGLLSNFDVGVLLKNHQSRLTGSFDGKVNWQKDSQYLSFSDMNVAGSFNGEPLVAQGSFVATLALPDKKTLISSLRLPALSLDALKQNTVFHKSQQALAKIVQELSAQKFKLSLGGNELFVDGTDKALMISVNAQNLQKLSPKLGGRLFGSVILVNDRALPTLYADLQISNLVAPSLAIAEGSIVAKLVQLGQEHSRVVLTGKQALAFGRRLKQLSVEAVGSQEYHRVFVQVSDAQMYTKFGIEAKLANGLYEGIVFDAAFGNAFGSLNQQKPAQFSYKNNRLSVAAHCWYSQDGQVLGKLCAFEPIIVAKDEARLKLQATHLNLGVFSPLLPKDFFVKARVSGNVNASWDKHTTPVVDTLLYSDGGTIGLKTDGIPDTTLMYDRLALTLATTSEGLSVKADIKAGEAGDGYVDVVIDPTKRPRPIKGALVLDKLNLAVFRPFFPALQTLAGTVDLAGGVGGTLAQPEIYGNATLSQGKLALERLPMTISDMTMTAQIRGLSAQLAGNFKSGAGTGELSAQLDWHGDWQAKIGLKGDRLELVRPPLLTAKISPEFEIALRPTQKQIDIKGVIAVPVATIRPPETGGAVVGLSPDVTVIDRRASADIDQILAKSAPWDIHADVGVDLGDEVVFDGFGARLPLAGALQLTQSGQGSLKAKGMIQVSKRAKVNIFGQNLELAYAQIRTNGSLTNPALSIMATRQIEGKNFSLNVTGNAKNPIIKVYNDAGLSEQQAMNALVTGRLSEQGATQISEQSFRSQVTNNLAAVGLSIGLQGTRGLSNDIGRALGFESLVVDTQGSAADTNVNITGYISPDLYIRYGVGVFNADTTLSVRYQLTRRVYIEATRALENIVDVVYRWRF